MNGTDYPADATAFNAPSTVELEPGERADVEYVPTRSGTTFLLPILAVSGWQGSTYEVRADGQRIYKEAEIPPTDIDDLAQTFYPPESFDTSLTVRIRNVGTQTRSYTVQPIGWETETGGE